MYLAAPLHVLSPCPDDNHDTEGSFTMEHINMSDDQKARYDELMANEELSIEELDTVAAGLSVSSLFSAACPVSCFSSISN
jgi:hypothetical protein